jgi:hypothetical protein
MPSRCATDRRQKLLLAPCQEYAACQRLVRQHQCDCTREGAQPELLGKLPSADEHVVHVLGGVPIPHSYRRAW